MIVDSTKYRITTSSGSYYSDFYEADLKALMEQEDAEDLVLKYAYCYTDEYHTSGIIHTVAVAVNADEEYLTEGKAALPCPPDCSGKEPYIAEPDIIPFEEFKIDIYVMKISDWLRKILSLLGFTIRKIKVARKS